MAGGFGQLGFRTVQVDGLLKVHGVGPGNSNFRAREIQRSGLKGSYRRGSPALREGLAGGRRAEGARGGLPPHRRRVHRPLLPLGANPGPPRLLHRAICPRLKATVAFSLYSIWLVLHVVVNHRLPTSKCKSRFFAAMQTFSSFQEGFKTL